MKVALLALLPVALSAGSTPVALSGSSAQQCNGTSTYCPASATCCIEQWSPTTQGCSLAKTPSVCCKPGPPKPPSTTLPNCLIIGDSVSIGYTGVVVKELEGVCQVQHGPWDLHDGGAETTAYATACLDNWLVTEGQQSVKWDLIFFNSGLHNLSNETAKQDEYARELAGIADRLLATGAKLVYGLTTPFMPLSSKGEMVVERLNALAASAMWQRHIPLFDLYTTITQHCGAVYRECDWCKIEPCSYHYNNEGYTALGKAVAGAIKAHLAPSHVST